ncbi:MAG: hypothetical protein H7Y17_05065 [Chlorobia bacterium]|nr:hypothetical protein [Fimbriimonadaceae bacterium]
MNGSVLAIALTPILHNGFMKWEATDQFGNLYIGISEASSWTEMQPEIASMLEELRARSSGPLRLTIDLEYSEISGPDPDRVSHILRSSWLGNQNADDALAQISEAVAGSAVSVALSG